jgi:pyridoxine 4-dehydrogenase
MLTGRITKPEDIPEGDFRKTLPRFQKENFAKNLELVRELEKTANKLGCTPAQLAISWIRSLSEKNGNPEIIPIPGSATVERVNENAKYAPLSKENLAEIESILQSFEVVGGRYGGIAAEFMHG